MCHHPARTEATPSDLERELPRSEHHKDAERFVAEGVPRSVFWWRHPVVFSALGRFASPGIQTLPSVSTGDLTPDACAKLWLAEKLFKNIWLTGEWAVG